MGRVFLPQEPKRHLLYIIGAPGTGKTTLARALVQGVPYREFQPHKRVRAMEYHTGDDQGLRPVYELGCPLREDGARGTDLLARDIKPDVMEWLGGSAAPRYVMGEGDRLAHPNFFGEAAELGYEVQVVHAWCPAELSYERASKRRAIRGMEPQHASWYKGRVTKHERLEAGWPGTVRIDTRHEMWHQVATIQDHPVVAQLARLRQHATVAQQRAGA